MTKYKINIKIFSIPKEDVTFTIITKYKQLRKNYARLQQNNLGNISRDAIFDLENLKICF